MTDVVVLGAGPAGLMAADELVRAGHGCTVIEASERVGGMAGSFEVAGQRVDFGSHRLHPASPPDLLAMIDELLGDDLQVRPRTGRLRLENRWVGFPLRAGELLAALPPRLTAKLIADSARTTVGPLRAKPATKSLRRRNARSQALDSQVGDRPTFDLEVTARLGPTVTDRFYGPYARKLYGCEPDALDAELARRRVSATSPSAIARRLFRARRRTGRMFLYPRLGYGQIVETLADRVVSNGAVIELGRPAVSVEVHEDRRHGRATVRTEERTIPADLVLSTIPITALADILEQPPHAKVRAALNSLRTRSMLLVYVVLDRPQYTEFDAHYLPGPETVIARISEPKNYRDGPDPADRTVLCAEIPCWPDDQLRHRPDTELADLVMNDLASLGLPFARPVGAEKRFLPSVYPVYDVVGRAARAKVDRWSNHLGPIIPLGRQGLRAVDNLHHVLAMGTAAAAAVGPDGAFDRARWARDLRRFAANVVED